MQRKEFDKIERYLSGELAPEERAAFERTLAQDADLALEVEKHRLEHDVMRALLVADLREKSVSWVKEEENGRGNARNGWLFGLLLVGVLGVGGYLILWESGAAEATLSPATPPPSRQEAPASPLPKEAEVEPGEPPPVAESPAESDAAPAPDVAPPPAPVIAYNVPAALEVTRLGDQSAGFAGTAEIIESIPFVVRPAEAGLRYRFRDTLILFLPGNPAEVELRYDAARDVYRLSIDGQTYPIERGFNSVYDLEKD
jgi:hypothetical protein